MAENVSNITRSSNGPRLLTLDAYSSERHASWLELVLRSRVRLRGRAGRTDTGEDRRFTGRSNSLFCLFQSGGRGSDSLFTPTGSRRTRRHIASITFAAMLAVAALSLTLGNAFTAVRRHADRRHLCSRSPRADRFVRALRVLHTSRSGPVAAVHRRLRHCRLIPIRCRCISIRPFDITSGRAAMVLELATPFLVFV